jgi:hypothetical protein
VLYSYIFKMETRVIFFYNTATFSFNFICKNKWYLKRISFKEPQFTGVGGYAPKPPLSATALNSMTYSIFFLLLLWPLSTWQNCQKHTYTRPGAADVTSLNLLYYICNIDFVVAIVIVQMCLAFKKSIIFLINFNYFICIYIFI